MQLDLFCNLWKYLRQALELGGFMGIRKGLLAASICAAVGACSPYNYSKEISAFSTGVDGLATSVTAGHDELVNDEYANRKQDLILNRRAVALSTTCGDGAGTSAKDAQPCAVQGIGVKSDPLDPDPIPEDITKELKYLKQYAQALAAVTKASDRNDYQAAVGQLSNAVKNLVAVVPGYGTAAAPVVAAGINVFGWLVGTALDEQRYETLKKAVTLLETPIGDPKEKPMHLLAAGLDGQLTAITRERQIALRKGALALRQRLGPNLDQKTYQERYTELEAIVTVMESLRKSDPSGAAKGLETTHKALSDALNDPKRQLDTLPAELGTFVDKVSALQAALKTASTPVATTKSTSSGQKGS